MRLVTSIQIAIGIVAGGSAVIALSGSAFAADSSTDIGAGTSAVVVQSESSEVGVTSTVGGYVVTTGSSDSPSASPADSGEASKDLSSSKVSNVEANPVGDPAQVPVVTGPLSTEESLLSDSTPGDSRAEGLTSVADSIQTKSVERGEQPVITVAMPTGELRPSGRVKTHSRVLAIQPTITNRTSVLAEDLAATVPSATSPAKAPVPAKSMGLLSNLTSLLASTVIPRPLIGDVPAVVGQILQIVTLLALTVLLANVFVATYGFLLRRNGFATAARSDCGASPLLPVATLFLLGHVWSQSRSHGPVFYSVRNEIFKTIALVPNAFFRKEEM